MNNTVCPFVKRPKRARVHPENRVLTIFKTCLFLLIATGATAQAVGWTPVQPGVWKAVIGQPEAYNLSTASGAKANASALGKLGQPSFPLPKTAITARVRDGKTYLHFLLDRTEQLYGFGLNFQTAHQILEMGNTNGRYRFRPGARPFVKDWNRHGPAHHCAVGVGHIASKIRELGELLQMETIQV